MLDGIRLLGNIKLILSLIKKFVNKIYFYVEKYVDCKLYFII